MAEPTFTQVFGPNATQNSTTITIQKADLAAVGYVPASANTGESSLLSIVLLAGQTLTESARSSDPVNRNVTIYSGGTDITTLDNVAYQRDAFSVLAYKVANLGPINPSDY